MDPQELIDLILTGGYGDYGSQPGDRFYLGPQGQRHQGGRVPNPRANPDAYEKWRMLPNWSNFAEKGIQVPPRGESLDITPDILDKLQQTDAFDRQQAIQKMLEERQRQGEMEKVPMY
jgi:hypothetical protein